MVCLEWWCLTDQELYLLLQQTKQHGIRLLKIHGYKVETLTSVPRLTLFSQFSLLSHLDLSWNNIDDVILAHVPLTVEVLNLSHNHLQVLPPLDKLVKLKELHVGHNNIQAVHPDLPDTPVVIDMSYNNIQVLPPLGKLVGLRDLNVSNNEMTDLLNDQFPLGLEKLDLSHNCLHAPVSIGKMTRLRDLNLSYNRLQVIHPLIPAGLEVVNFSGNPVKTLPSFLQSNVKSLCLEEMSDLTTLLGLSVCLRSLQLGENLCLRSLTADCFPSKSVYHLVNKALGPQHVQLLEQPLPQVFMQGHANILRYFGVDQCRCSFNHLTLVDASESGKTSLTRSLIKHRSTLTKNTERTPFLKVKTWRIDETTVYQIYDHGRRNNGCDSAVNHVLKRKNDGTILILHSLNHSSKHQIDKSLQLFKETLEQNLNSDIHFVLTFTDKFSSEACQHFVDRFKKSVDAVMMKEIELLQATEDIRRQNTLKHLRATLENIRYFPVSCKTYSGMENLRNHLLQKAADNMASIPAYWNQIYTTLKENGGNYAQTSQVGTTVKQIESNGSLNPDSKAVSIKTQDCLQYFNDIGMIIWTSDNFNLRKFVFHNIGFLTSLFSVLYQEDLECFLDYDHNKVLQEVFSEEQYYNVLKQTTENGLVHEKLLKVLWIKINTQPDDHQIFLFLLKEFQISVPISSNVKAESSLYYLPRFVSNDCIPDTLIESCPMIIDSHVMSVAFKCEIKPVRIPTHMFEWMCVCLQCYATEHVQYRGQRSAWVDGLMVKIGKTECWIYQIESSGIIWCCVRGSLNDITFLWQILSDIYDFVHPILVEYFGSEISSTGLKGDTKVLDDGFTGSKDNSKGPKNDSKASNDTSPGLNGFRNDPVGSKIDSQNQNIQKLDLDKKGKIIDNEARFTDFSKLQSDRSSEAKVLICFPCLHCVLKGVADPHQWSVEGIWTTLKSASVTCPKLEGQQIPTALVYRVKKGEDKRIKKAVEYVQDNWSAVPKEDQLSLPTKTYLRSKIKTFQALMLTSPVINQLKKTTRISLGTHTQLSNLDTDMQVLVLFNEVLLRGSVYDLVEFRQILEGTEYHTNVTLAKYLPGSEDNNLPEKDPAELLRREELDQLKGSFYQLFVSEADPDELIPHLCSTGVLHQTQYQELRSIDSAHGQLLYLMDAVILRGTYHTLLGVKAAFKQSQCELLLNQLPLRNEEDEAELVDSSSGLNRLNSNFDHLQQMSNSVENKTSKFCVIL